MISAAFLISALVVVLIPGTGVLYTIATGMTRGFGASLWAALGCTFGIVPAILAAVLGLSALLHTGALAYTVLKYAGAAYLIYLAWQTWNDRGPISFRADVPGNGWRIARTGTLINVLNPKLSVFFMAFLPQFLDPSNGSAPVQIALLGGCFMAMTFGIFILYGAAASTAGRVLRRPSVTVWIRRLAAGAFGALGSRLALSTP